MRSGLGSGLPLPLPLMPASHLLWHEHPAIVPRPAARRPWGEDPALLKWPHVAPLQVGQVGEYVEVLIVRLSLDAHLGRVRARVGVGVGARVRARVSVRAMVSVRVRGAPRG